MFRRTHAAGDRDRLRAAEQVGKEAVRRMKRGLITWHKDELPTEAFDARLAAARKVLAARDLPGGVRRASPAAEPE